MSFRTTLSPSTVGVEVSEPNRLLALLALLAAFVFPVAGLALSLYTLRRSKALGQRNSLAEVARNLSLFLLILYVVIIAIGLTASVIVPSLNA
jgi:hypothetical protein